MISMKACREVDDEFCAAHVSQLGLLLEMISKARDPRLVVWEDSFSPCSRFADLQLNAIEHWMDFEKRPRAYPRWDAVKLAREIELEEALRRDAAFIKLPNKTDCEGVVRGECTVDTITGERVGATLENWHFGDVGDRAEVLCGWAGLEDQPCGRLHDLQRMRWRAARRGCVYSRPDVPSTVARPPELSKEVHFDQKSHAPSYADTLLYAPPAPGNTARYYTQWTVPREGVAAKLAEEATAAWRQWGYDEGAVEEAASDPELHGPPGLIRRGGSRTKP